MPRSAIRMRSTTSCRRRSIGPGRPENAIATTAENDRTCCGSPTVWFAIVAGGAVVNCRRQTSTGRSSNRRRATASRRTKRARQPLDERQQQGQRPVSAPLQYPGARICGFNSGRHFGSDTRIGPGRLCEIAPPRGAADPARHRLFIQQIQPDSERIANQKRHEIVVTDVLKPPGLPGS